MYVCLQSTVGASGHNVVWGGWGASSTGDRGRGGRDRKKMTFVWSSNTGEWGRTELERTRLRGNVCGGGLQLCCVAVLREQQGRWYQYANVALGASCYESHPYAAVQVLSSTVSPGVHNTTVSARAWLKAPRASVSDLQLSLPPRGVSFGSLMAKNTIINRTGSYKAKHSRCL